jgi:flagellar biosynthetic protein FlhB
MAEAGGQERTETPTLKRREDARKQGQVAMSREVSSAAMLGAFALYFYIALEPTIQSLERFWRNAFERIAVSELTIRSTATIFQATVLAVAPMFAGVFAIAALVGFFATVVQVGVVFNPLELHGDRLNPLAGIQRIFSAQGAAEFFKSLFKLGVIGYVVYASFRQEVLPMLRLSHLQPEGIVHYTFALLGMMFVRVALALVVLALFDFLFQRWQLEQKLKMTRQELKEELKQTEGDPQMRARIRQMQREMSRARMMQNVPKADVIVTNPTHFAVALQYDRETMTAPRMLAKGVDFLAMRIREIGAENGVTMVENPFVARELFYNVDIGQQIPERFFRAVAEILAYVYRLKKRVAAPPA